MLQGHVTITTIHLSCIKLMSEKLHSGYRILSASLFASFAPFSQKLREWQHQGHYIVNPIFDISTSKFERVGKHILLCT